MAKKRKVRTVAFIFILAVVIALVFGIVQTTYGFSTLSVSNVEIIDAGSRIRVYGVANGAEAIQVQFNPSDINNYIEDDGYQATSGVTGSIGITKSEREFPFAQDNTKIFQEIVTKDLGIFSNCERNAPPGAIWSARVASSRCAYGLSQGNYAFFNGQIIDDTEVFFEIGGATGTLAPRSGTNTLTLNDGRTRVEWVGNLLNTEQVTTPFNYGALFQSSQYMKLIDSDAFSLQTSAKNTLNTCLGASRTTGGNILIGAISLFKSNSVADSCIDNYNNRMTEILRNKESEYQSSVNAESVRFSSEGVSVEMAHASVFPTFIITMDASKFSIIELKGEPEILDCVPDKEIQSGDTYSTSVRVLNDGDSDGSFISKITCSGPSDLSATGGERFVSAGQTVNMPIQVRGINSEDGLQRNNCNIVVEDRKSGETDSCDFSMNVDYKEDIICTPGSTECFNAETLRICNNKGTAYEDEDCELGCKSLEFGASCISAECQTDLDCSPDEQCVDNVCVDGPNDVCKWYQDYYEKEGIIFRNRITTGCKTSTWVYFVVGIILLGGFLGIRSLIKGPKKKKGGKK